MEILLDAAPVAVSRVSPAVQVFVRPVATALAEAAEPAATRTGVAIVDRRRLSDEEPDVWERGDNEDTDDDDDDWEDDDEEDADDDDEDDDDWDDDDDEDDDWDDDDDEDDDDWDDDDEEEEEDWDDDEDDD
jgi:hypothetical protein